MPPLLDLSFLPGGLTEWKERTGRPFACRWPSKSSATPIIPPFAKGAYSRIRNTRTICLVGGGELIDSRCLQVRLRVHYILFWQVIIQRRLAYGRKILPQWHREGCMRSWIESPPTQRWDHRIHIPSREGGLRGRDVVWLHLGM